MYKEHFALTRFPFEPTLEVDELYANQGQQEALARLSQLIEHMRGGIGLLTGEPGCGKSTVCRQLLSDLHTGLYRPRYVSLTTGSVLDLYNVIAQALGLKLMRQRAPAFLALRSDISNKIKESRQLTVLAIDEAHLLRGELLEELRLLTNYRMDSEHRLCLLLIGHSELRMRLAMSAYESLSQRVTARYHLSGLERNEVEGYLNHRMQLAGYTTPAFDAQATEAIAQASSGVPRRIDRLAHYALSSAKAGNRLQVNLDDVQIAIDETTL